MEPSETEERRLIKRTIIWRLDNGASDSALHFNRSFFIGSVLKVALIAAVRIPSPCFRNFALEATPEKDKNEISVIKRNNNPLLISPFRMEPKVLQVSDKCAFLVLI